MKARGWEQPTFNSTRHAGGLILFANRIGPLFGVVMLAACVGSFFVLRYLGLWMENDSAVFVRITSDLLAASAINYEGSYEHGYAYPTWLAMLSMTTGLNPASLIQLHLPLLGSLLLATTGFATFKKLLESERLGAVAAGVLLLVPELVFTVSRGNHEKLTIVLTLIALLALLSSHIEARLHSRWIVFAGWVTVYYFTAFTLVTLNAFFGSTFIVAATLSLVFAATALGASREQLRNLTVVARRLVIVAATSWAFVVLVMFFIYPPAGQALDLLATTTQRVSALVVSGTPESDPYAVTRTDWVSRRHYLALSSFRFILFGVSFASWSYFALNALRHLKHVSLMRLYMVAMYGAFGLQLAIAIPVDLVDLYAGSNLQVRLYTYFTLVAAPVFVLGLATVLARARMIGWTRLAISLAAVAFVSLSLSKASLEPAVSNRWIFYRGAEVRALQFFGQIQNRDSIWIGPDGRLDDAYRAEHPQQPLRGHRIVRGSAFESDPRMALVSDVQLESANVWNVLLPSAVLDHVVYDNGEAVLNRGIPRTPFQR